MDVHLEVASGLGAHVPFTFSVLGPIGSHLCRPCPCCQSLWVPASISPAVSERFCFLAAICHLWSQQSFLLLFSMVPLPRGEGLDEDIPCRTECPRVCYSVVIVQLESLAYLCSTVRGGFTAEQGKMVRSCFFILFLWHNSHVLFSLKPMAYSLSLATWTAWGMAFILWVDLKSK